MALEPITRQEKIIAGQDLTPITRLEKFLKNFGGSGGGGGEQPDLSQTDTTKPDYVKGIIRQESLPEGYPYKEQSKILAEWDGNAEGMLSVDLSNGHYAYKVCEPISSADLIGVEMKSFSRSPDGEESANSVILKDSNFTEIGDGVVQIQYGAAWIFTDAAAASETMHTNIPEAGVYFYKTERGGGVSYPISLTVPETIHLMAEELLPLLTSPNGTKYKLTVADDGTLSAVAQS